MIVTYCSAVAISILLFFFRPGHGVPATIPSKHDANTVDVVNDTRVWLTVLYAPKKNFSLFENGFRTSVRSSAYPLDAVSVAAVNCTVHRTAAQTQPNNISAQTNIKLGHCPQQNEFIIFVILYRIISIKFLQSITYVMKTAVYIHSIGYMTPKKVHLLFKCYNFSTN